MLFNNLRAYFGPQVDAVESPLVEVTSQPILDDALTTINTSSTPREITPLIVVAPTGVPKERLQELLLFQQANLEETMEKRFLVECMETSLLINNTLDSSLKSFNDLVLFNINLLMQQWLPPATEPPSTTIPPLATTKNLVPAPPPSPPSNLRPSSTEG